MTTTPQWIVERANKIASNYVLATARLPECVADIIEAMQDAGREVAFYFAGHPALPVPVPTLMQEEVQRVGEVEHTMRQYSYEQLKPWTEADHKAIETAAGAQLDDLARKSGISRRFLEPDYDLRTAIWRICHSAGTPVPFLSPGQRVRNALSVLVMLKDKKDYLDAHEGASILDHMRADYNKSKPAAWKEARKALRES